MFDAPVLHQGQGQHVVERRGAGDGVAVAGSLQARPAVWTMSLDRRAPLDDLMTSAAPEHECGDGRLRTNIGAVATLDMSTIISVRP